MSRGAVCAARIRRRNMEIAPGIALLSSPSPSASVCLISPSSCSALTRSVSSHHVLVVFVSFSRSSLCEQCEWMNSPSGEEHQLFCCQNHICTKHELVLCHCFSFFSYVHLFSHPRLKDWMKTPTLKLFPHDDSDSLHQSTNSKRIIYIFIDLLFSSSLTSFSSVPINNT